MDLNLLPGLSKPTFASLLGFRVGGFISGEQGSTLCSSQCVSLREVCSTPSTAATNFWEPECLVVLYHDSSINCKPLSPFAVRDNNFRHSSWGRLSPNSVSLWSRCSTTVSGPSFRSNSCRSEFPNRIRPPITESSESLRSPDADLASGETTAAPHLSVTPGK